MRYVEMPRDVSCDNIAALRIHDRVMDSGDEEERSRGGCGGGKGGVIPMCTRGSSPPSSIYCKVVSNDTGDIPDGVIRPLTKQSYSYGTLPRVNCHKSASLPVRGKGDPPTVLEVLRVSPEDLAIQITRIDFPIFKSIAPEELTSIGWTKKDKVKLAPNVVEFTRRFNHISFWVVREILNAGGVKQRSDLLSHFIRVAKRLHDLSNLHSTFAVISALQSAPIYRLSKTWSQLSKKDRQHYERLVDLFSDKNNWEQLRSVVNSHKLPMIPYLGLFLTDLVYIDMAHPHFGGLESEQRRLKMNNLLRVLADYQHHSDYSQLPHHAAIQNYLTSVRYIEELQKFVEDDHYKLSLQLEPNTPATSHSVSKDSLVDANGGSCHGNIPFASLNLSPARGGHLRPPGPPPTSSCPAHGTSQIGRFIPGHRKARSLGSKFRSMSLPRNLHRSEFGNLVDRFGIFRGCSGLSNSERSDSLSSVSSHDFTCPSAQGSMGSRHLLDDSELDPPPSYSDCTSTPKTLTRSWSAISSDSEDVVLELNSEECAVQGPLKRKTIMKEGRRPPVSAWHRYWVQLWGGSMVYYHPKSLTARGTERCDFKTAPCKLQELLVPSSGAFFLLEPNGGQTATDVFQLSDPSHATIYKFRAPSVWAAKAWAAQLSAVLVEGGGAATVPENLITFE